MNYQLVLKNGRLIDPAQGLDAALDVAFSGHRIAKVACDIPRSDCADSFDASGCIVTPGLIDMHTHVYWGANLLSLDAERYAPITGTTTWMDAGTSGGANFAGFRRYIIAASRTRIVPFLNVSAPGLTVFGGAHENVKHLDTDLACKTIEENRDLVRGVKVLSSGLQVGANDLMPLRVAREIGEAVDLPVMCHIGCPPPGLYAMLPLLRKGDIVTHAYKGRKGCLVITGNRVRPEAWEARQRGIVFDVGHGVGSFSWEVARAALEQGFPPDTISTDLHSGSLQSAVSMPAVMSKFLHLGLDLADVVRLSTTRPAQILGMADQIGTLREGACGDVAVLREEEGSFPALDCEGVTETLHRRLVTVLTVQAGEVMSEPEGDQQCT